MLPCSLLGHSYSVLCLRLGLAASGSSTDAFWLHLWQRGTRPGILGFCQNYPAPLPQLQHVKVLSWGIWITFQKLPFLLIPRYSFLEQSFPVLMTPCCSFHNFNLLCDFKVLSTPLIHPSFEWLRLEGGVTLTPLSLTHVLLMMEWGRKITKVGCPQRWCLCLSLADCLWLHYG